MIPALAKYDADLCINASFHLLKSGWKSWKISWRWIFFHLYLCSISRRDVYHFGFCLSAERERLLLHKSMLCHPTSLNGILWDHILRRRCLREQTMGSSAVLLLSPSSCCKRHPRHLSVTGNTPKAEHMLKFSPKNRSSASSCFISSPLCRCRTSVIRQGGHWCSTAAATFWKGSKITALVACPLFRSAVVFMQRVRALSLSLLTKFLL